MKGFFGRYLVIDVGARRWNAVPLDDTLLRRTLGGKGLATQLLLQRTPAGVDPLSPENCLIFALGPAVDTPIYGSCRHGVYSKSPLTGFYGESYSGGKAAIPMSRTGYDAIVIEGASSTPVWLEVTESEVRFHDASDLWGKETFETEDAVLDRAASDQAGAVVIGPAGENLVRYALMENDYWRSAGRCGMGAVLGSKKIKAVVFHGGISRPVADEEGIKAYAKETVTKFKDHKATQAYRTHGTPMMVALLNTVGGFPTRYWSKGTFEHWRKISAEILVDRFGARPKACRTCFMGCGKYMEIQEGRHKGLKIEGPEYETIYAFGGLCEIGALDEIAHLNDLCDRLGVDTITAGNMAAFAIEASRRGKIRERLDYGDVDGIAELIEKVAKRDGIGDLLAQGIRTAAAELGLEDLAVHVKGLEPAGYDPRALKGMGLAYAVSGRGACHLRSTFYKAELAGLIDPKQIEGKAELFLDFEDRCTLFDCLILCRFYRDFYPWEELAKIVALTTGERVEKVDLQRIASFVVDSTRWFNLREGLTAADDRLPRRLLEEPLEDGRRLTAEEINRLVQDYYRLRGWNPLGVPPSSSGQIVP